MTNTAILRILLNFRSSYITTYEKCASSFTEPLFTFINEFVYTNNNLGLRSFVHELFNKCKESRHD